MTSQAEHMNTREAFVAKNIHRYAELIAHKLSLEELEETSRNGHLYARQDEPEYLSHFKGNEALLLEHVKRMAALDIGLEKLRHAILPALKKDPNNHRLWHAACTILAQVNAESDAIVRLLP
jgi:hypothetical protein